MAKARGKTPRVKILVDSREKDGWTFAPSAFVSGSEVVALKTGDYTMEGYESVVSVERKGSVAELASNVSQPRFAREMDRLEAFPFRLVVCEFTLDDVVRFPAGSGVPPRNWRRLRVRGPLLLRRVCEYQVARGVPFVFAGAHGKAYLLSFFKRVVEARG